MPVPKDKEEETSAVNADFLDYNNPKVVKTDHSV